VWAQITGGPAARYYDIRIIIYIVGGSQPL
jgi:hypothetical protein